jgi:chorismate mutase
MSPGARVGRSPSPILELTRAQKLDSTAEEQLSLANIRRSLILMEDTIIFSLIERSQYALNAPVYEPGATVQQYLKDSGRQLSLLEYLLMETEHVHGKIRRFDSSEENAFFPSYLPPLILPPLAQDEVLWGPARGVTVNDKIMDMYKDHLLPGIALPGDDGNYGSSAMYDVMILQALSKRIHFGKFVAESKFRKQRDEYSKLIGRKDEGAIMDLLTDRNVELKVIERVKLKASTFGQDLNSDEKILRLDPDAIGDLYDTWVMPLTKIVEVEYLLRRLD